MPPFGLILTDPELPVQVVQPAHLAVNCQWLPFTLFPVLRRVYVAPVYATGVLWPLREGVRLESLDFEVETYVAHRDETVAFCPLGYATVSGFLTMLPPQARPIQPSWLGTTACITALYGPDGALLGSAKRKTMLAVSVKAALYSENVNPVSWSI